MVDYSLVVDVAMDGLPTRLNEVTPEGTLGGHLRAGHMPLKFTPTTDVYLIGVCHRRASFRRVSLKACISCRRASLKRVSLRRASLAGVHLLNVYLLGVHLL